MKCRAFKWFAPLTFAIALIRVASALVNAQPVRIEYWHPWGFGQWQGLQQQVVDEFNAAHPDIQVDVVIADFNKLTVAIAAGSPPDVAVLFEPPDKISLPLLFQPIDHFLARDGLTERDFVPGGLGQSSWDGRVYGLPYVAGSYLLYWNTSTFAEVGLDPAQGPETWSELESYMRRTTVIDDSGAFTRIGLVPWNPGGRVRMTWFWSNGGDFYDPESGAVVIDSPQNIDTLTWLSSLANEYGLARIDELSPNFFLGTAAMQLGGPWDMSTLKHEFPEIEFDAGPIPRADSGRFANPGAGEMNTLYIPAGSDKQEQAWVFVRYMVTRGVISWSNIGAELPAYLPASREVVWWNDPRYRKFVDFTEYNIGLDSPINQFIYSQFHAETQAALRHEKTPAQAIKDLHRTVEARILEAFGN